MTQRRADENDLPEVAPVELRGFAAATTADPRALARLRVGLASRPAEPARPSWAALLGLGLGFSGAAALLLWWGFAPGPSAPGSGASVAATAPLAAVDAPLGPTPLSGGVDGAPALVEPVPGLRLQVAGQGELSGTRGAPMVRLRSGSVRVEVDPAAGLAVSVQTQELQVDVLGTIFDVQRDAMGASVQVERGKVAAACAGAAPTPLTAGQRHSCAPTTAAGMLARARGLQERAAEGPEAGAAVLEAVRAGLAMADGTPGVRGELHVVAFEQLDRAGDAAGALAEVDAYLRLGGPRAGELAARAAQLAMDLGGCGRALNYAQTAAASGTLGPDDAPRACLPR